MGVTRARYPQRRDQVGNLPDVLIGKRCLSCDGRG